MIEQQIQSPPPCDIAQLGPWFHNLHLPDGRQSCPDSALGDFPACKWELIAPHLPDDLHGWSCLDIGCNAGFYSFELARRGAEVLGIDTSEHYLRQARWAARQFDLSDHVRFERMQVYDLARIDACFDLIWFMGVFYHLRYPMLALDIVAQKVRRMMVFQTLTMPGEQVFERTAGRTFGQRRLMLDPGWPKMAFFEHGFADDPTNWWAPNHAAVEAMLRSSGMRNIARPIHETYICQPDPHRLSCIRTWNRAELEAATGQSGI